MENNDKPEKTKVCAIFEPTYRSIMTLPIDAMKLRMFCALCDYAFDEHEPEFGPETEERILAALWEQFRVVFVQAAKRSKINSINGSKGGRPKKTDVTEGLNEENPENPTVTETDTLTITMDEETASCDSDCDYDLEFENYVVSYNNHIIESLRKVLNFEPMSIFSKDLITDLSDLFMKYNFDENEISEYIAFVVNYVSEHSPENKWSYLYKVITTDDMVSTFHKGKK